MAAKFDDLKKIAASVARELGYECVGAQCGQGRGGAALRVFIDSPDGIKHADCERVSRAISENFDRAEAEGSNFFQGKYFIEVSSPGVERPLFTEEHYARFAGSRANLSVKGRGKLKGLILSCVNGTVTFRTDEGEDLSLPFGDISKGNIAFEDSPPKSRGGK